MLVALAVGAASRLAWGFAVELRGEMYGNLQRIRGTPIRRRCGPGAGGPSPACPRLRPWSPQHHRERNAALSDVLLKNGLTVLLGLRLGARMRPIEAVAQALERHACEERLHHDLIEEAVRFSVSSSDAG